MCFISCYFMISYWLQTYYLRYRHLGQFAPLGGEQTAAQLPGDWISIGHSSQWLWYSVYARYFLLSIFPQCQSDFCCLGFCARYLQRYLNIDSANVSVCISKEEFTCSFSIWQLSFGRQVHIGVVPMVLWSTLLNLMGPNVDHTDTS